VTAQRRLDEAEGGARVLRERAASEVARLQTEAHEHRRAVREEATTTLAAARTDADAIRTEARDLLVHARSEVRVLAERRDDITEQLGHLSGVIEALAVSEHSAVVAEHLSRDAAASPIQRPGPDSSGSPTDTEIPATDAENTAADHFPSTADDSPSTADDSPTKEATTGT